MKKILVTSLFFITIFVFFFFIFLPFYKKKYNCSVKVGILCSLTGPWALYEKAIADALLLAIEEINQHGGLLHKQIEPLVIDMQSEVNRYAVIAEQLITQQKVSALFGCWTSESRCAVKKVVEKHSNLLFYPASSEGLEESEHIIYTGAIANQHLVPGVSWIIDNIGKNLFFIGSDDLFSRAAAVLVDDVARSRNATIAATVQITKENSIADMVNQIIAVKPDALVNTLYGEQAKEFLQALRNAGITAEKIPTLFLRIGEIALQSMPDSLCVSDYAVWGYVDTILSDDNRAFIERFKKRYGLDRIGEDSSMIAYYSVYLWAQGVKKAQLFFADKVIQALIWQSCNTPEGVIAIDGSNNHTWRHIRVGKIQQDKQFRILWSSEKAVFPQPYPAYRTKREWQSLLMSIAQTEER